MHDKREYTFERKVHRKYEEKDLKMEHRDGAHDLHHFKLSTGDDKDFFSKKNTGRRGDFNKGFIDDFNEATGHNLDHNNIHVKKELRRVHDSLRNGEDTISFRVGRRMEH